MTGVEPDDKVKLGEILKPPYLSLDQNLGSRKILKVFMIHNNIDGIGWTFQVVLLNFKSFKDGKQFLIMCVIVQLCYSESTGVKGHQMNFIFFVNNGKDCSESIVQSISFYDELSIGNPMSENRDGGECFLKRIGSIMIGGVELPRNILSDEAYQ